LRWADGVGIIHVGDSESFFLCFMFYQYQSISQQQKQQLLASVGAAGAGAAVISVLYESADKAYIKLNVGGNLHAGRSINGQ